MAPSNRKEQTVGTHYDMDELQSPPAERKKPVSKGCMLHDSIHVEHIYMFWKRQNYRDRSQVSVVRGHTWGRFDLSVAARVFWGDGDVLYLDCGVET